MQVGTGTEGAEDRRLDRARPALRSGGDRCCVGMSASSALRIETEAGTITLRLRPDAAPETCRYILQCVASKLYDSRSTFYRSDFVIQFGLHGSGVKNPHGDISVNETHAHVKLPNRRGTCSVAHWDVPDCGNTECFINLGDNGHLDEAYGGYCVFAEVAADDDESFATVDKIATMVKGGQHARIVRVQAFD